MQLISKAFVNAKRGFNAVLKDKNNPFFQSRYADLGACLEAVNDALLDCGIAVFHETFDCPGGVCVETVFLHESGETLRSGRLSVPATKQDAQGYGSALTYARRYSLLAACGMAPEDDDGNAASKKHVPQQAPAPAPAQTKAAPSKAVTTVKAAVAKGDASSAATYMAKLSQQQFDVIYAALTPAEQDAISDAWPDEVPA